MLSIIVSVLSADWISGLFHWFEDTYVHRKMPVLGKWFGQLAEDNRLHHEKPRAFLQKTIWQSSWDLYLVASIVLIIAACLNRLSMSVWIFAVLVAHANLVHRWAHQSKKEKGLIVYILQKFYILQTPRMHANHHSGQKNSHYCVITNLLNPILEKINFWRNLEWILNAVLGLKPHTI